MNEEKYCQKCEEELIDKIPGCPLQCSSLKCKAYHRKPKTDFSTKPIVWVMGAPGSGKGTQCQKIKQKYGYTHISVGNLLREEIKKGGDRTKCLENALEHATLVPTDIVISLVLAAMEACVRDAKGFLIDGYPREGRQGRAFERHIGPANVNKNFFYSLIIFFEASQETVTSRLRFRKANSNRIDDNQETVNLQLITFYDNNDVVMEQYKNESTFRRINAERTPDQIFADVQAAIDSIVLPKPRIK